MASGQLLGSHRLARDARWTGFARARSLCDQRHHSHQFLQSNHYHHQCHQHQRTFPRSANTYCPGHSRPPRQSPESRVAGSADRSLRRRLVGSHSRHFPHPQQRHQHCRSLRRLRLHLPCLHWQLRNRRPRRRGRSFQRDQSRADDPRIARPRITERLCWPDWPARRRLPKSPYHRRRHRCGLQAGALRSVLAPAEAIWQPVHCLLIRQRNALASFRKPYRSDGRSGLHRPRRRRRRRPEQRFSHV